jgi:transposase-like protein
MGRNLGTPEELERHRRRSVALVEQGWRQCKVARFLGVAKSSVSRWVKMAAEGGPAALAAKPHPRHPPKGNPMLKRLEAIRQDLIDLKNLVGNDVPQLKEFAEDVLHGRLGKISQDLGQLKHDWPAASSLIDRLMADLQS